MEVAVVAARLAQFAAGVILFGTPLFLLYGYRGAPAQALPWPRRQLGASAMVLLAGALVSLIAQTAMMAGDPAMAFDAETLAAVAGETAFGAAIAARVVLAGLALAAALAMRPGHRLWLALAVLGGAALATFAWTGHGATEEGAAGLVHAAFDILHLLAAGVWLGALMALVLVVRPGAATSDPRALRALHAALVGFSGVGSAVVAVLLLTGLANSWFLVGLDGLPRLTGSPYGLLLIAKLALFAAMLGLAAANRFRHTPALARALEAGTAEAALPALRRSVALETVTGLGVLALVSVLGTLAPIAAQ
jgi:putative copper resistance protein D